MQKSVLLIMLLFTTEFSLAQPNEITKLLNQHFEFEQGFYDEYETSKPLLVSPFQIKKDTLMFEHKVVYDDPDRIMYIKRAVHLKNIKAFIKDVNVIFVANSKSVKETQIIKNQEGKTLEVTDNLMDLFFTELSKDPDDQYTLRLQMLNAFKKGGYEIISEYWYN